MDERLQVARLSVASNTVLVIGKVAIGWLIGSVSVISEGIHSGLDLMAALIAYFSVREASKPADESHHFGHGKIENVAGTIEALLIFIAALWIIWEAVHKLQVGGAAPEVSWGALIMALSAGVNYFVSSRLMAVAKKTESVALKADAMHLRTDVYTSLGVLVGLLLLKVTGWWLVDPLVAIGVALLIMKASWDLLHQAFLPLLDSRLPEEEEEQIQERIERHAAKYVNVHEVRTRRSGAERHIDMHMVFCKRQSVEETHEISDTVEKEIQELYPKSSVLIHQEPCNERCGECKLGNNRGNR
ncbi:cation diffusion facilitator family transporter [Heliobacillus mobilis]|uniref:Cation diffusion facilitator family transporter n=1 Tax=Heliobacterium mobile TaxID=28064 RepID=A0A6I3SLR3_HELMO|nr:cation diffusion facilitator family transporter [Heliobacterium mobile]MTV49716.1 cation diffusion facilitator family transporter [Heliobacterium mobile]